MRDRLVHFGVALIEHDKTSIFIVEGKSFLQRVDRVTQKVLRIFDIIQVVCHAGRHPCCLRQQCFSAISDFASCVSIVSQAAAPSQTRAKNIMFYGLMAVWHAKSAVQQMKHCKVRSDIALKHTTTKCCPSTTHLDQNNDLFISAY